MEPSDAIVLGGSGAFVLWRAPTIVQQHGARPHGSRYRTGCRRDGRLDASLSRAPNMRLKLAARSLRGRIAVVRRRSSAWRLITGAPARRGAAAYDPVGSGTWIHTMVKRPKPKPPPLDLPTPPKPRPPEPWEPARIPRPPAPPKPPEPLADQHAAITASNQ